MAVEDDIINLAERLVEAGHALPKHGFSVSPETFKLIASRHPVLYDRIYLNTKVGVIAIGVQPETKPS